MKRIELGGASHDPHCLTAALMNDDITTALSKLLCKTFVMLRFQSRTVKPPQGVHLCTHWTLGATYHPVLKRPCTHLALGATYPPSTKAAMDPLGATYPPPVLKRLQIHWALGATYPPVLKLPCTHWGLPALKLPTGGYLIETAEPYTHIQLSLTADRPRACNMYSY